MRSAAQNQFLLLYIILLIKEQVDLVNYFYDISFIQNANNKRKKTNYYD